MTLDLILGLAAGALLIAFAVWSFWPRKSWRPSAANGWRRDAGGSVGGGGPAHGEGFSANCAGDAADGGGGD